MFNDDELSFNTPTTRDRTKPQAHIRVVTRSGLWETKFSCDPADWRESFGGALGVGHKALRDFATFDNHAQRNFQGFEELPLVIENPSDRILLLPPPKNNQIKERREQGSWTSNLNIEEQPKKHKTAKPAKSVKDKLLDIASIIVLGIAIAMVFDQVLKSNPQFASKIPILSNWYGEKKI